MKRQKVICECGWTRMSFRPIMSLATHKAHMHKPINILQSFLITNFSKWLSKPEIQQRILEMYLQEAKLSKLKDNK